MSRWIGALGLALVAGTSGCSELMASDAALDGPGSVPDVEGDADDATSSFFLEVVAPEQAVQGVLLLPQTFGPFADGDGFELALDPAIRLDLDVRADRVTPWLFTPLPTEDVAVPGDVALTPVEGGGTTALSTDDEGRLSVDLVPGVYRLGITPFDARVPPFDERVLLLEDAQQTMRIDAGAAVWGRVVDEDGEGIPEARVHAVTSGGQRGPTVLTDDAGWYELRVLPDTVEVVTEGRANRRDPTLVSEVVEVGDEGLRLDLAYADHGIHPVFGRLVDGDGTPLVDATVRVTSVDLADYSPGATYQVDLLPDSRGFFDTLVPSGTYTLDFLPETGDPWSPAAQSGVVVDGDTDLDTVALTALRSTRTRVTAPNGLPLSEAALTCRETGPSGRTFSAATDPEGTLDLDLPRTRLSCILTPPGERPELAAVRLTPDDGQLPEALSLTEGRAVGGTVTARGEPISFATIRVLDTSGEVWGYGLTDDRGAFRVPVQWGAVQTDSSP